MDKLIALAKRRGFIFQSSEIYGGLSGFWDYGPLGVELKNNLKQLWWKTMVQLRNDVVGVDAAIIMNPKVWQESGHLESFTDPLVECKLCHKRFRKDKFEEFIKNYNSGNETGNEIFYCLNKTYHPADQLTEEKNFNLLTEVYLGVIEPKQKTYLRGEITQGVFVNFKNVLNSTRIKLPFGIAQIGKAFRNEITPGNFTFRSREFEQMELEYFIRPDKEEGERIFNYWKSERMKWYINLGVKKEQLRFRDHLPHERAHYARYATDIEYHAPFGWSEFEGIHHRGDWDLSRHKLQYRDEVTGEEFTPWVIETSGGVDRAALFFLVDSYFEDEKRIILKLHPKLAPYKAAVFPLVANKKPLVDKAREVYQMLLSQFMCIWDDRGNIGQRYLSQDEIGTPWCITIDYDTLLDNTVTIRFRDTTKQIRIDVNNLQAFFDKILREFA